MPQASLIRRYVILRPLCGSAGGFLRLEIRHGHMSVRIRATQVQSVSLRALLLSGDPSTGAVIDLGLLRHAAHHQTTLALDELPASHAACHTLVICTDWPDAQLVLYGFLTPRPACPLWQLQAIIRRYLAVPARDAILPAPAPLSPAMPPPALCALLPRR